MDLDDDTLALLGYATDRESYSLHEHQQRTRIAPGAIDGRSRRNWRHREGTTSAKAGHETPKGARTPVTRNSDAAGAS